MKRDASGRAAARRDAYVAETAERRLMVELSFRQMIRAGLRYAMVPQELAPDIAHGGLSSLVDGRRVCGAVTGDGGVYWICLLPDHLPGSWHGWSTLDDRTVAYEALVEQTDPIRRIERRALMALEGVSAFPHLAADMPSA